MPQQIKHPFDPNHVLSLLPTPIYKEGYFKCDACGKRGDGFSYHCDVCSIDLHTDCATMPLQVVSGHHRHHRLDLTFSPPYQNKTFGCDVCKGLGFSQWLYRCGLCEFDAHLLCARKKSVDAFQQTTHAQSSYGNQMNNGGRISQAVGIPLTAAPPPLYNQPVTNYNAAVSGRGGFGSASVVRPVPMNGGRQRSNSLNSIFRGIQNINQSFNDQLVQGIIGIVGGGNGGGNGGAMDGGGVGVDPGYNLDLSNAINQSFNDQLVQGIIGIVGGGNGGGNGGAVDGGGGVGVDPGYSLDLSNAINVNDFGGIDIGGLAGGLDLSSF